MRVASKLAEVVAALSGKSGFIAAIVYGMLKNLADLVVFCSL